MSAAAEPVFRPCPSSHPSSAPSSAEPLPANQAFLARWRIPAPDTLPLNEGVRPAEASASLRPDEPPVHPDHHLWRNGRRWWVAFCVLEDGWRQERVRLSLGTTDRHEARTRRDALFARLAALPAQQVSLRLSPRKGRSQRRKQGG